MTEARKKTLETLLSLVIVMLFISSGFGVTMNPKSGYNARTFTSASETDEYQLSQRVSDGTSGDEAPSTDPSSVDTSNEPATSTSTSTCHCGLADEDGATASVNEVNGVPNQSTAQEPTSQAPMTIQTNLVDAQQTSALSRASPQPTALQMIPEKDGLMHINTTGSNISSKTSLLSDLSRGILDGFWMDWHPSSDPYTIDGGWFETETWSPYSVVTLGDFDNTPSMSWTDSPGIYSAVRTDEDLWDGTTAEGAWCSCAAEQGSLVDEDSRGYAWVEKTFQLSSYVGSEFDHFTNCSFWNDYYIYSPDFDNTNDYVYFNILLNDGTRDWPMLYQYKTGAADAPSITQGGWCTDVWDPSYAAPHGANPNVPINDYHVYNVVDHVSGDYQYYYTLADIFNSHPLSQTYTLKIRIDVRLLGGAFWNWEQYQWWSDDAQFACSYEQKDPDLHPTSLTISPTSFCPGNLVSFTTNIQNIGYGDIIDPFYVNLYRDGTSIGQLYYEDGLAAGAILQINWNNYQWPNDCSAHTIKVKADTTNLIAETSETNNELSVNFQSGCPAISISAPGGQNPYDFGNRLVGTDSSQAAFTVTDTGNCPASGSVVLTGSNPGDFVLLTSAPFSLNAGGSKIYYVVFHPTTTGPRNATLRADGTAPCGDADVNIKGTGCLPIITLTPSQDDFGNVNVGTYSPSHSFTLTNTGCWQATGYVTLTGAHPDQYQFNQSSGGYFNLAPGGTRTILVSFHPNVEGDLPALLQADGDDPCNLVQSTLYGHGYIPLADITLTPASHDFEDTYIHTFSTEYSFTLTNTGGHQATGIVYLAGTNANEFNITQGGGSYILDPGQPKTIKVRFEPTIPGEKTAYLKADLNSPAITRSSTLTGTALSRPPNKPTLTGQSYGFVNMSLHFTGLTTDPDAGQTISYYFDWGDGTNSGWSDPVAGGTPVTKTHSWSSAGTYSVRVKARDNYNVESAWSDLLSVTIYNVFAIPHYAVIEGEWNYPGTSSDIPESYNNAFGIFTLINDTNEWTRANIHYYSNRGSTNILADLHWMKNCSTAQSICLFYYSGHGTQIPDDNGDEQDGMDEALYCSDGNCIRDDLLNSTLNTFNGVVVVILECCNAGGMPGFWTGTKDDNGLIGELSANNRIVIAACGENEDSHTGGGFTSLFTHFIGLGWLGAADLPDPQHPYGDDQITAEETFSYASQQLAQWIQDHGNPFQQTPEMVDNIDGDVPLIISGFAANNSPPGIPFNPSPSDGSTDVPTQTSLSCTVTDPDNDALSVAFYWDTTPNDILIGFSSLINSGGRATISVSNLAPLTSYHWYVVSNDGVNTTTSPVWSFTTSNTSSITNTFYLKTGWNLMALPVSTNMWASGLAGNITNCQMVTRFDAVNQTFRSYIVGGPPGFDFPLEAGYGYFVLVSADSVYSITGYPVNTVSVPLAVGWNMIGWYHQSPTLASVLSAAIPGCEIVSCFDAVNQTFRSYIVGGPPGFDFTIASGMGLMVRVNEASIWTGQG